MHVHSGPEPEDVERMREQNWPSLKIAWIAVALLSAASMVAQLDRIVINLLVEPIKSDFHLSDTGFGALQGIAFGVFYTLMNVVFGRLADRHVRKTIVGIGLLLFSLFSLTTGFVRSYLGLFFTRAGVGVGEASLFPATFSIISDYFPPRRMGMALGVFMMSQMIGIGLAYVGGGVLVGWITETHFGAMIGTTLEPWRLTIILVGLPGLVLAPFLFLLPEPKRRGSNAEQHLPLSAALAVIWHKRAAFFLICAAMAAVTLVHYAMLVWASALFIRVYHLTPAQSGTRLGVLFLLVATGGTVTAGILADHFGKRGVAAAPLKVAAGSFVAVSIFGGLAPLMPSVNLATAFYVPYVFLVVMPYPCAAAALQMLFPNCIRSQASGLYLTIINLVGFGVGPAMVGLFTDRLFTHPSDVRYSLAIVTSVGGPSMVVLMLLAARQYRKTMMSA